jgi:diguanylate cyclase (GGDEF)-like protein/PAS domain S-box-containing protein
MSDARLRVLHIGGTTCNAERVWSALTEALSDRYDIQWVGDLADALQRPDLKAMSAILLDLPPAPAQGLEALKQLLAAVPAIPVLVVGADETEQITGHVIRAGARDYLLLDRLDSYWLPRAIRYAIDGKLSEEAFVAETERVEATLDAIGDGLLKTDTMGRVTHLNRVAEAMTGWPYIEAAGRPLGQVLHIVDRATREPAGDAMAPTTGVRSPDAVAHCALVRRDGSEFAIEHSAYAVYDRLGHRAGANIVLRDISAARATTREMAHLASHDPLTDLPNRLLLGDRLARALALAHRHHRQLAVLFLDIDRFKHINDSFGHALGDQLLQSVGREVTMCVRSSDTVSRRGGDEFVVVLSELEHSGDAAEGARKIIAALSRPFTLAGHELHITVSIGISVFPDDGADGETLLKRADMALYHAKDQGRARYQFFKPALHALAIERQSIESGLHRAIDQREFELLYQPKINLQTGGLVGAEALIRWQHPQRGSIEPAQFVPIAEDSGLITPIGRWVLYEACRQARAWQDAGLRPIPVSVNVSGVEFRSSGFLTQIVDTLEETRLDPSYLEVELTESVLMAEVEATTSVLHALNALGVQLAIDDFGTGSSSLSYLRYFPIHTLKIDKSFVREITSGSPIAPLVSAVISMGKSLNLEVIAEGVETRDQVAFLKTEGCAEGQGYYFSRPLPSRQFARLLKTWATES